MGPTALPRIILGLSLLLGAQPALSADLPVRAPWPVGFPTSPKPPKTFDWTGLYVGVNGGFALGGASWTNQSVPALTTSTFNTSGAVIGATLGYNWQANAWVAGLETDFDWTSISGSNPNFICGSICEAKISWVGTLRGRIGYSFDSILPYATGGLAYAGLQTTDLTGAAGTTNVGWVIGGGVEYRIDTNVSAKAEYLYVDFGKVTCSLACSGGSPFDVNLNTSTFRLGLNFRY